MRLVLPWLLLLLPLPLWKVEKFQLLLLPRAATSREVSQADAAGGRVGAGHV